MDDTAAARLNMVESQVRTADVTDLRIQDAMRRIAREGFLPVDRAYLAYADVDQPPPGAFDLVVSEGAVAEVPATWLAALGVGGRAAVIERRGPAGRAVLHLRTAEGLGRREGFDAAPPYLPGMEPQARFAF